MKAISHSACETPEASTASGRPEVVVVSIPAPSPDGGGRFPASGLLPWVLLLPAIVVSGWLFLTTGEAGFVGGCPVGNDCTEVLSSRYSRLFGIPVTLFGVSLYGALLVTSQMEGGRRLLDLRRIIAWAVVFGALWFAVLQIFFIRGFCPWCTLVHLLAVAAAVVVLFPFSGIRMWRSGWHLTAAGGMAAVFAGAQLLSSEPDSHRLIPVAGKGDVASILATDESGRITAFGTVVIDPSLLPYEIHPASVGGKGAVSFAGEPGRATVLFAGDWTCAHCMKLHKHLQDLGGDDSEGFPASNGITVLHVPVFRNETGRDIHRLMLTVGAVLHVWGFRQTATGRSEWFLASHPSWTLPGADPLGFPEFIDLPDGNVILGSVDSASRTISTATVATEIAPRLHWEDWLSQHFFLVERGDPSVTGSMADPDGDGLSNRLEYALGTDARQPETTGRSAGMKVVRTSPGMVRITFPGTPSVPDAAMVETSADLMLWSGTTAAILFDPHIQQWTLEQPLARQAFWRLTSR